MSIRCIDMVVREGEQTAFAEYREEIERGNRGYSKPAAEKVSDDESNIGMPQ